MRSRCLPHSSVTTTQLMRKDLCSAFGSTCHEATFSWCIALASCVVAIAIGCKNRVMQFIVVPLLSLDFSYHAIYAPKGFSGAESAMDFPSESLISYPPTVL